MKRWFFVLIWMLFWVTGIYAQDRPVITQENAAQIQSTLYTGQGNATVMALSPDGSLLIVGTAYGAYFHNTGALGTQQPFAYVGSGVAVNGIAFNPDGTQVALVWNNGAVEIYDPNVPAQALKTWFLFAESATAVAFTPDGATLMIGNAAGRVLAYSITDEAIVSEFSGLTSSVVWLGVTPDGKRLIASSPLSATPMIAWDLATGETLYTLNTGTPSAFSPDGSAFVLPVTRDTMILVDAVTGEQTLSYSASGYGTSAVTFLPDGRVASAGGDYVIRVDDVDLTDDVVNRAELRGHHTTIDALAASPDGTTLYSVGDDGVLMAWDISTSKVREHYQVYSGVNYTVIPMQDNQHVAIGGSDGFVTIWDVETDTFVRHNPALNPEVGQEPVYTLDFTPDESLLVVGNSQGFVQGFTYPEMEKQWSFFSQATTSMSLEISPDGNTVAVTGGGDGLKVLQLYPTDGSQSDPIVHSRTWENASVVHWTPNGITVTMGILNLEGSGQVLLFTVDKDVPYFFLNVPGWVYDFAYSAQVPNGDLIALASGPENAPFAGMYNFATQATIPLVGQVGVVNALAFSPDGTLLVTGANDGILRLFEVETGALIAELPQWHTRAIRDVAFSPDGTRLFSTGADGITMLWQIP